MSKILRLKIFREINGLSQTALAQQLGIALKTIQNYEKGKTDIPSEVISYLCEKYYLDAHWLITGEGPMYRQAAAGVEAMKAANDTQDLTQEEKALLEIFRSLPKTEQEEVAQLARKEKDLADMRERVVELEKIVGKSA